jgi:hypothetical protein
VVAASSDHLAWSPANSFNDIPALNNVAAIVASLTSDCLGGAPQIPQVIQPLVDAVPQIGTPIAR